jgi:hypothetical protein
MGRLKCVQKNVINCRSILITLAGQVEGNRSVVFQLFVVSKKAFQVGDLACLQGSQYCDTVHDHTVSLMGDCSFEIQKPQYESSALC